MVSKKELILLADSLFIHGHNLSRWIVDYVDLEESLAIGSIAQDQIAHASSLYELAGVDPTERDRLIFERPAVQWEVSRLVQLPLYDWPGVVVQGWLFSSTCLTWLDKRGRAASEDVKEVTSIIWAEQHLNLAHWDAWIRLLASNNWARDKTAIWIQQLFPLASDLFATYLDGSQARENNEELIHTWTSLVLQDLATMEFDEKSVFSQTAAKPNGVDAKFIQLIDDLQSLRAGQTGTRGLYK